MKVRAKTNLLEIPAVEELNVRTVTEAVSNRWRTLKSDLFSEDDFLSFYEKKMVAFLIKMFEWCRRMDGSFDKNAEPWLHL